MSDQRQTLSYRLGHWVGGRHRHLVVVWFALFLISATYLPWEWCNETASCEFWGWQWIYDFRGGNGAENIYWPFLILEWGGLFVSGVYVPWPFPKR